MKSVKTYASYRASLIAQVGKNLLAMQETLVQFLGQKDPLEKGTPVFLGFPCVSAGKESARDAGDLGSIPGLGRSQEKGKATHSSILAWRIPRLQREVKSRTRLSDFHFHFPVLKLHYHDRCSVGPGLLSQFK